MILFLVNCVLTILLCNAMAWVYLKNERHQRQIEKLQDERLDLLSERLDLFFKGLTHLQDAVILQGGKLAEIVGDDDADWWKKK